MATDIFLKLDGVKGENSKKGESGLEGAIELHSFSFGVVQAGSHSFGGAGGGSGKAQFQDMSFVKNVDKSSPLLFKACATGEHIKTAELIMRRAGGGSLQSADSSGKAQKEYYRIRFTDVIVSSLQNSGSAEGDTPTEMVSLNAARIDFEYKEQLASGELGGAIKGGYDVKQGTASS